MVLNVKLSTDFRAGGKCAFVTSIRLGMSKFGVQCTDTKLHIGKPYANDEGGGVGWALLNVYMRKAYKEALCVKAVLNILSEKRRP